MRRDVQDIFRQTPHEKQCMMFSATLSKEIRPVCKKFMQDVMKNMPYIWSFTSVHDEWVYTLVSYMRQGTKLLNSDSRFPPILSGKILSNTLLAIKWLQTPHIVVYGASRCPRICARSIIRWYDRRRHLEPVGMAFNKRRDTPVGYPLRTKNAFCSPWYWQKNLVFGSRLLGCWEIIRIWIAFKEIFLTPWSIF